MRIIISLMLTVLFVIPWFSTGACAEELSLKKGVICLDVKDRLPVGEAVEFPASTTKVFCYTEITGAKQPTEISHVWYYQGKKMRELTLPVRAIRWRTWSNKNIHPGQVGAWSVEVIDTALEKNLGTIPFRIQ